MQLSGVYIYIDGSDLFDVAPFMEGDITKWKESQGVSFKFINVIHERTPDMWPEDLADWDFGINLNVDDLNVLPEMLDFMHSLAIKYERDFVLGFYYDSHNISEDILFFGARDGAPSLKAVTDLLGISLQ